MAIGIEAQVLTVGDPGKVQADCGFTEFIVLPIPVSAGTQLDAVIVLDVITEQAVPGTGEVRKVCSASPPASVSAAEPML